MFTRHLDRQIDFGGLRFLTGQKCESSALMPKRLSHQHPNGVDMGASATGVDRDIRVVGIRAVAADIQAADIQVAGIQAVAADILAAVDIRVVVAVVGAVD